MQLEIPDQSLVNYVKRLTRKEKLQPALMEDCDIIHKINPAYQDWLKIGGDTILIKFIIYHYVKKHYNVEALPNDKLCDFLDKLFSDIIFMDKIYSMEFDSEFFSVLKDMMPFINKLNRAINDKNHYEVMKCYEAVTKMLDTEALANYTGDELERECKKRFQFGSNDLGTYKHLMGRKLSERQTKPFDKSNVPSIDAYSQTCRMLAYYLYRKVMNYYNENHYIYLPINDELSCYEFDGIIVIGYKYFDNLGYQVEDERVFTPENYEFWAIINKDLLAKYKVNDAAILDRAKISGKVVIAPVDDVDEALLRYKAYTLNVPYYAKVIKDEAEKIGIPKSYMFKNNLLTNNNLTYFRDLRKVDGIETKNLDKYAVLKRLKSSSEEEREQYLKHLIIKYNQDFKKEFPDIEPKQEEPDIDDLSPRDRRKENPKAWCN